MSRRDTIIVAALINAGLLIILFVSALKNPSPSESLTKVVEKPSVSIQQPVARIEPRAVLADEVDQVLSQYAKVNPMLPFSEVVELGNVASEVVPVAMVPPSQNFVDDLNALTKATEQVPVQETVIPVGSSSVLAFKELVVKKGDVLEKIAKLYHTNVQELMKVNKLSSTNLHIGQVLKVPNITGAVKASVASAKSENSVKYYTVKSGDNPWTIAVKNHLKVEELLRLNNMDEARARKLKPGDQMRIR
ncbi:MAG: LysM peptidoglycan-binding domain-containing protein [Chlamydiia bacterium]